MPHTRREFLKQAAQLTAALAALAAAPEPVADAVGAVTVDDVADLSPISGVTDSLADVMFGRDSDVCRGHANDWVFPLLDDWGVVLNYEYITVEFMSVNTPSVFADPKGLPWKARFMTRESLTCLRDELHKPLDVQFIVNNTAILRGRCHVTSISKESAPDGNIWNIFTIAAEIPKLHLGEQGSCYWVLELDEKSSDSYTYAMGSIDASYQT